MKRTDSPNGRTYEIDGRLYPSVTSILSCYPKGEQFLRWLANQGSARKADDAKTAGGTRGTNVHRAVEVLLGGGHVAYSQYTTEELYGIRAARDWIEAFRPEVIWTERTVHSPKYGFAGTADCFCRSGLDRSGVRYLMDWKTSKGIWPSYEIQLQAYAQAMKEARQSPDRLLIVRLPTKPDSTYEVKEYEPSAERLKIFLACLTLWHETHPEFSSTSTESSS